MALVDLVSLPSDRLDSSSCDLSDALTVRFLGDYVGWNIIILVDGSTMWVLSNEKHQIPTKMYLRTFSRFVVTSKGHIASGTFCVVHIFYMLNLEQYRHIVALVVHLEAI